MLFWHHIPWGVDFRGGTLVYVKFSHTPDDHAIRAALDRVGLHDPKIQDIHEVGQDVSDQVLIDLDVRETSEQALDQGKTNIIKALESKGSADNDLNNVSFLRIKNYLMDKDPLHTGADDQKYTAVAQSIVDYRDKTLGGVLRSIDQLNGVADPAVVASLKEGFFLSDFGVGDVAIVWPQVGAQLRKQAAL